MFTQEQLHTQQDGDLIHILCTDWKSGDEFYTGYEITDKRLAIQAAMQLFIARQK